METDDDNTQDQQVDETGEQSSTDDQAGDGDSGVEGDGAADEQDGDGDGGGDEADGGDGDEGDPEDIQLLTPKQIDELKGDPKALMKALNRAATKKFQGLADQRKALEPYADFIQSYQEDPKAAAIALVEGLGLKVEKPKTEAQSEKAVEKLSDQITAKVKAALGPEYEDVADKIALAVQEAANLVVAEAVKPLKEGQDALISESAERETNDALTAFAKSHPDWKKYDAKMTALSAKFKPGEGVTPQEYLETLYQLASADGKEGDAAKKVAKRMNRSAKKAASNGDRSMSSSTVTKSPGKLPTFAESAAAARRGERFD